MKKFEFTLQPVFEYKLTVEKTQKAELSRAEAQLRLLLDEERRLNEAFERNSRARDEALTQRVGVVGELTQYDAFFRHIREEKEALAARIAEAEEEKSRCQSQLIATMKELKTYRKLRGEQYERYLKEVSMEEEKEIGDIVSFSAVNDEKR